MFINKLKCPYLPYFFEEVKNIETHSMRLIARPNQQTRKANILYTDRKERKGGKNKEMSHRIGMVIKLDGVEEEEKKKGGGEWVTRQRHKKTRISNSPCKLQAPL